MTLLSSPLPLLKVCPLGLNERSLQALTVFFERQLADSCALVEHETADVALINLDALDSGRLIEEQLETHHNQPMILMTLNPEPTSIPGAVFVQKPVKMDLLFDLLKDLRSQVHTPKPECHFSAFRKKLRDSNLRKNDTNSAKEPIPTATHEARNKSFTPRESHFYMGEIADLDLNNHSEREKIYYDASRFLHSFVHKASNLAIQEAAIVKISSPAFGYIEIYPFARKVISSAAPASLYAASRLAFRDEDITITLSRSIPQFTLAEITGEELDPFLWKLTLWASRGRLPAGTNLETPIQLSRWPNLPRLLVPPHATKIAGFLAREPVTLAQSIKTLGIEQRYVFAFYSACVTQGLVTQFQAASAPPRTEEKPVSQEKRSVFRMLMNKLLWNQAA